MSNETLLVVEDNSVLRIALEDMLVLSGFEVVSAADGIEALDQLEETYPDLILSDVSMPRMDGFKLYNAVRQRPEWVSIPFIFLTARGEQDDVLKGKDLGVDDYLIKPVSQNELVTTVRSRLNRAQQMRIAQLSEAYESTLTLLANAIEVRDSYTRFHVERVTAYSMVLARELGWSDKQIDDLRFGAILHDIGKIHISGPTLRKNGPLTVEEWNEMRKHTVYGAEMIKNIPYLSSAIPGVLYHHEFWDGQGYPRGLFEDEIPMTARIIAVADTFDAMTTDRAYRGALKLEEAYNEIVNCGGTKFDPEVVDAFKASWERGEFIEIVNKFGEH